MKVPKFTAGSLLSALLENNVLMTESSFGKGTLVKIGDFSLYTTKIPVVPLKFWLLREKESSLNKLQQVVF